MAYAHVCLFISLYLSLRLALSHFLSISSSSLSHLRLFLKPSVCLSLPPNTCDSVFVGLCMPLRLSLSPSQSFSRSAPSLLSECSKPIIGAPSICTESCASIHSLARLQSCRCYYTAAAATWHLPEMYLHQVLNALCSRFET